MSTSGRTTSSTDLAPDHAAPVRRFHGTGTGLRWDDVPLKAYKPEGTHFKSITRQVLFDGADGLPSQLRYFEIDPGGYSTLERHHHVHAVLVLRGRGRVLVGDQIHDLAPFDLVHVPPLTWHQFRAADTEALGFLCLVDCDRDRPIQPNQDELARLRGDPAIAAFVRT